MRKHYQWHWNAKDVADWKNDTFDNVMNAPAREILSIILLMQARAEYNKISGENG